ncbi:LpqB family beta-propeller domain-containing protein [Spongisporangium articulatum]|uniref:LpqB family beta-propeller domain-containing protein n=1 Tax=Spongisporangium articulatum TaxID=3362603 RepID=A0ABW8AJW6_9ACTN
MRTRPRARLAARSCPRSRSGRGRTPARAAFTAAAVVLGLALAGCAQIPRTGPVVSGGLGDPDPREGISQVIPEGPVTGADPERTVLGFVRASVGFGDDHSVARDFLATGTRLAWRPDADIDVYPGEKDLSINAKTTEKDGDEVAEVTVRAAVSVHVDGDGRYEQRAPGTTTTKKFELRRELGEWRISKLDDGILIGANDFRTIFRSFPVYFPDPTGSYLIPDVHWFAASSDTPGSPEVPTALVRVLLQGPPSRWADAVTTGAPPGTKMALGAVVVSDAVADVDLSSEVLQADSWHRLLLVGQLEATLGQLRNIGSVRVTVRKAEFDTGDAVPAPSPNTHGAAGAAEPNARPWLQADPPVGDQALVIDDKGRLAWLSGRSLEVVDAVDGLRVDGVNRPAVSADHTTYAALDADRGRLLMQTQGSDKAVTVTKGSELVGPSFDPQGWVWTGVGDNRGSLVAGRTGGDAVKVTAKWLDGATLNAVAVSRDGARALVAATVKGTGRLYVAGVRRDDEGRPKSLTDPFTLIPDLKSVVDATWVDEDQVAVLGERSGSSDRIWVAQIGGPVAGRGTVKGAKTITAGDGEASLSVGTDKGTYSFLRNWQKASSARWASYPG